MERKLERARERGSEASVGWMSIQNDKSMSQRLSSVSSDNMLPSVNKFEPMSRSRLGAISTAVLKTFHDFLNFCY